MALFACFLYCVQGNLEKSARASEAKDRAVAGALAVAVTCSAIEDDNDANVIMDSAFTAAAAFITKSESDEVASQIVNIGSSAQSLSISKKSALKLRAGLARFVIDAFNRHSTGEEEEKEEESDAIISKANREIIIDAIIDAKVWETLLNSETFGEVPKIDGGGESNKEEDEETHLARKDIISWISTRITRGQEMKTHCSIFYPPFVNASFILPRAKP